MDPTSRGTRALAAEYYRDSAHYERELAHVLRPGWHAVARWDDLPTPGDYAAVDLCGEPLLLLRDEERRLRVFSRVCRHRAHTVVEGKGNAKRLVCPYHRWSYDLEGKLLAAPLMEDTPGFDRGACGLPELCTESWLGFLLVSPDPQSPSIAAGLAALTERFDPLGLSEMLTIGVLDFDSPWNWKVLVENFMESYHHLGPHVQSFQKTNRAQDTYSVDLDGPVALLENPGIDGAPAFSVGHAFPTLLFATFEGLSIGSWYEMQIEGHDHFHLRIHMLAGPELAADPETVKRIREATVAIHHEDIAVCDGVQRGLASRLWEPGPLSRHEAALSRFHQYLTDRLKD